MDSTNLQLAAKLISPSYISVASSALTSRSNLIKVLLSQRCLPDEGWDDLSIESFLQELAMMDTNNYLGKCGVGEREGRVFSDLVAKRHSYMTHGIGRSGDISAEQPKAAGSSLMLRLTENLMRDALKLSGLHFIKKLLVLPLATGMTLSLALSSLATTPKKQYIIWPRIDQKTCLKCIFTSGYTPIVVEPLRKGDALTTDIEKIRDLLATRGGEIACVLSTTSCFAPRIPDDVAGIAALCKEFNVAHVVNNAYGIVCGKIANALNHAVKHGRVDCVVSSTDKNFLVPVGGAVAYSADSSTIDRMNSLYPGRASAAPILDLFITFLSMGKKKFLDLLSERKANFAYLQTSLKAFADRHTNLKVLDTKENGISIGLDLSRVFADDASAEKEQTNIGGMLYNKRVMGSRVVTNQKKLKDVCGILFKNYGSHEDAGTNLPYLTAASAIGMKKEEVDLFLLRLDAVLKEISRKTTAKKSNQEVSEDKEQLLLIKEQLSQIEEQPQNNIGEAQQEQ